MTGLETVQSPSMNLISVLSIEGVRLHPFPYCESMTRLVTAPGVGLLIGGVEGCIVFVILTIIYMQQATPVGLDNGTIYQAAIYGIVFGGFVGAVIGLIVALTAAGGRGGLLIGSLMGVAMSIYVLKDTGPHDNFWRLLAVILTSSTITVESNPVSTPTFVRILGTANGRTGSGVIRVIP